MGAVVVDDHATLGGDRGALLAGVGLSEETDDDADVLWRDVKLFDDSGDGVVAVNGGDNH